MKLLEDWSALVSTNCNCLFEDPDTGEEVPAEDCHGCEEWMQQGALDTLEEWLSRNDWPDAVLIKGVAIGWRRLAGYALIREAEDKVATAILKKLALESDFTLELKLTGKACHAVRYSHDEPTGASFELHAFTPCDGYYDCQAVEGLQEVKGRVLCPECIEWEGGN